MSQIYVLQQENHKEKRGFLSGIALTLILALTAKYAASFPLLNMMGQLVLAILLGMIWRAIRNVPEHMVSGISFSSKKLLRYGIILLGMRLNLRDILHTGPKVAVISILNVAITIFVVYSIAKWFKVEKNLGLLTACGTGICGAAAVVAIAPQIKAKDEEAAIGAATVAILGTIFTITYTLLYPFLHLSSSGYGIFAGATLHEIAHVIAAAEPVNKEAVDLAVMVKLTRVALLVPVAMLMGFWSNRQSHSNDTGNSRLNTRRSWKALPIPWFILGFLIMSAVNTLHIIPHDLTNLIIVSAYLLIAMAMAGLGLTVDTASFRQKGLKAFTAGFIGSVILSLTGYALIRMFGLG
ncbi:YeiH family protein [Paenibacillus silvae]|uniref:YeiH family protein n=1 Tax=Paenibacillus silvae TaxID=1325358 RepID=UPI002005992E|nr:YeiH family protein [Paenibacillus silvae]MCK6073253.1 YeiH family protein [Paenibacillus silvae]MCK6149271.1 YeiH family protein [Paenibacillus silvae]MCK6267570.1 YeiH family protein [Paenibacillus silvae]